MALRADPFPTAPTAPFRPGPAPTRRRLLRGAATSPIAPAAHLASALILATLVFSSTLVSVNATVPGCTSAYATAVLANSPFLYYPLQETSGLAAGDCTGSTVGTYTGTYTLGVTGATTGTVRGSLVEHAANKKNKKQRRPITEARA